MILKSISDIFKDSKEAAQLFQSIKKNDKVSIEGITASSFSLIISAVYSNNPGQILVVTKNAQTMQELFLDLSCYLDPEKVLMLPPWETLPYEFVSPSERVERERISAIYKILKGETACGNRFCRVIDTRCTRKGLFCLKKVLRLTREKNILLMIFWNFCLTTDIQGNIKWNPSGSSRGKAASSTYFCLRIKIL